VTSPDRVVHRLVTRREYYVARVGRALEVRCQSTDALIQTLEPPAEWGDNWFWSCCRFDGLRCVPLDTIRFIKTDLSALPGGEPTSPKPGAPRHLRPAKTDSARRTPNRSYTHGRPHTQACSWQAA